jgi:hypothetical protein
MAANERRPPPRGIAHGSVIAQARRCRVHPIESTLVHLDLPRVGQQGAMGLWECLEAGGVPSVDTLEGLVEQILLRRVHRTR